jgi:glycosyltransferase involved in cell wall biosynthesis
MEAMALRVPVVATKSGGPSEIIEDGISGFLVEAGDKEGITGKVVSLLKDNHQREVMGQNGQERIRRYFNLNNTVVHFNEVFEELLSGNRSS